MCIVYRVSLHPRGVRVKEGCSTEQSTLALALKFSRDRSWSCSAYLGPCVDTVAQASQPSPAVHKVSWKCLGFVHGSGAWSLTKLRYLRAKARGSHLEKEFCKVRRLINLFLIRQDGGSRRVPQDLEDLETWARRGSTSTAW